MTTAETTRSAYPAPVEELLPRARELAVQLGKTPSRNLLMTELKVGAPKAKEVLAALTESGFDPAAQAGPKPGLHLVPNPTPTMGLDPGSGPTAADPNPVSDPVSNPVPADPDLVPAVGLAPVSNPGSASLDPAPRVSPNPVSDPTPVPAPADSHPVSGPDAKSGPAQVSTPADPGADPARKSKPWAVLLLAAPAFVAIWSGWVGLGGLTGFGVVHPLPGIWDSLELNTAITLPIGVETYAAYALRVWLSGQGRTRARSFAKWSAIGSLVLGATGQVAYHLMTAAGMAQAPWQITTLVACLPVAVLGMGAALAHLQHNDD